VFEYDLSVTGSLSANGRITYGAGVSAGTHFATLSIPATSTVTAFNLWIGNSNRGRYLITAHRSAVPSQGSTVIAGSSSSTSSEITEVLNSNIILIGVSGSSITVENTSTSTRTVFVTAIPIGIQ
jgi:hypothetical protein